MGGGLNAACRDWDGVDYAKSARDKAQLAGTQLEVQTSCSPNLTDQRSP